MNRGEYRPYLWGPHAPQGSPPAAKAKMSAPARHPGGCWIGGSSVVAGFWKFVGPSAWGWSPLSGLAIRGRFLDLELVEMVGVELA